MLPPLSGRSWTHEAEDTEPLPEEQRYTQGRDAQHIKMAANFNSRVKVHIEQLLDGSQGFFFRRAAIRTSHGSNTAEDSDQVGARQPI